MANLRILVVEDSVPIATQLRQRIEAELGFEVDLARDYAQGTALIDAHGADYFLAILDLSLPDAPDGEIVDYAVQRRLPVIVYTSQEDSELRKKLLAKNIIDYVFKNNQGVGSLVRLLRRLHRNTRAKVLVVDDSTGSRRMMRSLLKTYMFKVHVASNGELAMAVINKHKDISLVITDFDMPSMDGVTLCAKIREQCAKEEMAIIGVSARDEEFLPIRFIKNGANDFIRKPFQREEFYLRVVQNQETIETFRKLKELGELKNRFLGIAAHDLRNPINGIKGFSDILSQDLAEMGLQEQLQMCDFIKRSSTQMLDLVNDLLDISVIESGKLDLEYVSTDLTELVRERIEIMRITAGKKDMSFETSLEEALTVSCDPKRFAQVVDNLLSNAVKFSPKGGVVNVALSTRSEEVELRVTDQGPGIPKDQKHRLFKSFSRLDTLPTGEEASTGLGLSIVKKIMDTHQGQVGVDSKEGHGASFHVSLPLSRPDQSAS